MAKLIGIAFLLLSTCAAGILASRRTLYKIEVLEVLARFCHQVGDEIRLFRCQKEQLLRRVATDYTDLFNLECLETTGILQLQADTPLGTAYKERLQEFLDKLGTADWEAEVARCEHYAALFSAAAETDGESARSLAKLYRSMGFLGGIFVALILV